MKQKEFEKLKRSVEERIAFEKFEMEHEDKKYRIILIVFLTFTFFFLLFNGCAMFGRNIEPTNGVDRNYNNTNTNFGNITNRTDYPDYYGGSYFDEGNLVIQLTENTLEHQEEMKKLFDGNESIRFETVLFSFQKMQEVAEKILEKKFDFVDSIEINEKKNRVVVYLNSYTEENIEKLLDRSGILLIEKSE